MRGNLEFRDNKRGFGCAEQQERFRHCAALFIRLTGLKPRDPPKAGAHQKQGAVQPFRGRRMSRAQRSSKPRALPWVNTALVRLDTIQNSIRFLT